MNMLLSTIKITITQGYTVTAAETL